MGIKFLCPNGHKLNVKSFLSGKKAICPKCGARVVVPEQDSALVTDHDGFLEAQGSWAGNLSGLSTASQMPVPLSQKASSSGIAPPSASATITTTEPSGADPIEEAPAAVWYVRPSTGGQFGPASGEIMRAWLNEGRVGASSLVWRAGWADWRSAAATFPQLGSPAAPGVALPAAQSAGSQTPSSGLPLGHVVQSVDLGLPGGIPSLQETVAPLSQSLKKRRPKNDASLIASAILVVISIILVIVLILVIRSRMSASDEESVETRLPASNSETG